MSEQDLSAARRLRLGRVAAVVGVVAALAVVAAAVGDPSDRDRAAPGSVSPTAMVLGLDALIGALMVAAVLLVAFIVWALATSPKATKRVLPREPAVVATVVLLAVALLLVWQLERTELGDRVAGFFEQWQIAEGLRGLRLPSEEGEVIDPAARRVATAAGALALLVGAGALWWWRLRDPEGREVAAEADRAAARLADAVDAALDDIDDEPDPRRAILHCYARLDAALTDAGCARRPAETAREHRHRAADTLGPAARAAARLVDGFERARYDNAPVSQQDRREAVAALHEVRAALAADAADAGSKTATAARGAQPPTPGSRL